MSMFNRGRRVVVGAATLAIVAAAAGTATASTAPPDAGSGAAATGEPVTIAVLVDETGGQASPAISTIEAAAEAINAEGGLLGHPIEIAGFDIKSDIAAAQAAVAEIPDDAIAVLLSSSLSEATIADSLSDLGIPILGAGYNPTVWGGNIEIFGITCETSPDNCANPNFLTTTPTIETTIGDQLLGAINVGATIVTSASCAEVDSCSAAAPIFDAIGQSLGLTMVPGVKVSTTAADYSAECIGFVQEGVEYVQLSGASAMGVGIITSCLDQGYEGSFGASAGSVTAELLTAPGQIAGGLNGFPWFVDDPLVVEYRDIVTAAGIDEHEWARSHTTALYANLRLIQKAINDYGDPAAPLDGAAALAAMYQVTDEDLGGLLAGPVTFREDDLDRTRTCFWPYIRAADGSIDNPVGGLNIQCYPDTAAGGDSGAPAGTEAAADAVATTTG